MAPIPTPNNLWQAAQNYLTWASTTTPEPEIQPIIEERLEALRQEAVDHVVSHPEEVVWFRSDTAGTVAMPSTGELFNMVQELRREVAELKHKVAELEAEKALGKRFLQKTKSE